MPLQKLIDFDIITGKNTKIVILPVIFFGIYGINFTFPKKPVNNLKIYGINFTFQKKTRNHLGKITVGFSIFEILPVNPTDSYESIG